MAEIDRDGPTSAKITPNFHQKARSAFLFYKFYKFSTYLLFNFSWLRGYR